MSSLFNFIMVMRLFSDPSGLRDFMLQRSVEWRWRCAVTEFKINGHNFKLPLLNIVSAAAGSSYCHQRISVPSKLDKICTTSQSVFYIFF